MIRLSYWVFPLISGVVWLGMLLGLLIHWCVNTNFKHYVSMSPDQHIAYISDVGAGELKPLFIAGSCVTTVFLDLAFLSDLWLRHRGRLVPNMTRGEHALSILTVLFAAIGTCGLILLSIFDTAHHPKVHNIFLLLFIGGYILSAICTCWQYQRLGIRYREHRVLRASFWIKLAFVIVEVLLAVAFIVCNFRGNKNAAAVIEWVIALIFTFYVFAFFVDLFPAVHTRKSGGFATPADRYAAGRNMEETGSDGRLTGMHGENQYQLRDSPNGTSGGSNNFRLG